MNRRQMHSVLIWVPSMQWMSHACLTQVWECQSKHTTARHVWILHSLSEEWNFAPLDFCYSLPKHPGGNSVEGKGLCHCSHRKSSSIINLKQKSAQHSVMPRRFQRSDDERMGTPSSILPACTGRRLACICRYSSSLSFLNSKFSSSDSIYQYNVEVTHWNGNMTNE